MSDDKLRKIMKANGEKVEMSYNQVCKELGLIASIRFVEITTAGTIGYTLGKPSEVRELYDRVMHYGFVPSKSLKDTMQREFNTLTPRFCWWGS